MEKINQIPSPSFFRDDLDDREVFVTIKCLVYNHEKYIREALEGFVIQQTNFRFEAIVHDDHSTDNTAAIIREYAHKYPSIIKPIFETENQYSKHNGSLNRVMDQHTRGKYVALCEGDDYWIDPYKLQNQVDFMEMNPELSLSFHAHYIRENLCENLSERHVFSKTILNIPMDTMIMGGGSFMATCSMIYRKDRLIRYDWARRAPVGDCALMLCLALNGKVGYLDQVMSCYRIMASNSWTQKLNKSTKSLIKHSKATRSFWKDFDKFTNRKYHKIIIKKNIRNWLGLWKKILTILFH